MCFLSIARVSAVPLSFELGEVDKRSAYYVGKLLLSRSVDGEASGEPFATEMFCRANSELPMLREGKPLSYI